MKKLIRTLIMVLCLLIFININTDNTYAYSSLSKDSATSFLRFLTGKSLYNPSSDNKFYQLLTGKLSNDENTDKVKEEFIFFVYESIDANIYGQRLYEFEKILMKEVPTSFGEIIKDTLKDALFDFAGVSFITDTYDNAKKTIYSISAILGIKDNAKAKYFKATIGFDKTSEYVDLLLDAAAAESGVSSKNRKLVDEWTDFMYGLEKELLDSVPSIDNLPDTKYNICFNSNCSDVNNYEYTYYVEKENWTVPTWYNPFRVDTWNNKNISRLF